jgi:3-mercaptopyruvate sulfurtransferase SseA
MGMFDTIKCEHPLPDPRHQELEFQTKDLERYLNHYTITLDGRLIRHPRSGERAPAPCRDIEWPIHGDLRMYAEGADSEWVEYVVRFTHGRLEWIERAPEEPPEGEEHEVAPANAGDRQRVHFRMPEIEPLVAPSLDGRRLRAEEFIAHVPEKMELLDGHIPGEEPLLLLLLASVGLRRAAGLVGPATWARALRDDGP